MTEASTLLWAYLFGWQVYSLTLVERPSILDIAASYLVGLIWPIHLPAKILKKVLS